MIQVGGYQPSTVIDFEIPKRYGLRQTIGDTLGIGGIMRALRTIPVMLDIADDMAELCPDALFLNYTNPMAMLTWAMNRATGDQDRRAVPQRAGHGERHRRVGRGHREHEVDYLCAGINHMAFYLALPPRRARSLPGPEADRGRAAASRRTSASDSRCCADSATS